MTIDRTLISFDSMIITLCVLNPEILNYFKGKFDSRHFKFIISSLVRQESLHHLSVKLGKKEAKKRLDKLIESKKMKMEIKNITKRDEKDAKKILKTAKNKYGRGPEFIKDAKIIAQLKRLDAETYTTDHYFHKVGVWWSLDVKLLPKHIL